LAGIDIREGVTQGVADLEIAYLEYGLSGLTLTPCLSGVSATDPRYYPLYALSEKMDRLVHIHSSQHFNPALPIDFCSPAHIDRIAIHFPGLRLVLGHGGIGFGTLGCIVASRHDNMYIDFCGLRPKYLPKEMITLINSSLRKRAIFGSNFPTLPYESVEEWKDFIKPENHELFFGQNALRVFGLSSIEETRVVHEARHENKERG